MGRSERRPFPLPRPGVQSMEDALDLPNEPMNQRFRERFWETPSALPDPQKVLSKQYLWGEQQGEN